MVPLNPGRSNDLIILLGAGASAAAGIPTSADMIQKIEELLKTDNSWKEFAPLYYHVKSAIFYAAGLRGRFNNDVSYNIETLVNTLYELEKNEIHPLYPFIASWNARFVAIAGSNFPLIAEFRKQILHALKDWMCLDDWSHSDYYSGLLRLQETINFPLPVFSLNYDTCVERLASKGFRIETGFGGYGPNEIWNWERFGDPGPNDPPHILLYKLHGSTNWMRTASEELYAVEQTQKVHPEKMEIIFGRDFKLEAGDPYLFYAYEFRRHTLESRLIVTIGYGYGDLHINKMISQALAGHASRRLLAVSKISAGDESKEKGRIVKLLDSSESSGERISVEACCAKEFLTRNDLGSFILKTIPRDDEVPF